MIITKDWINKHKTANGAWNRKQLEALGVSWPARKGWQKLLINTVIDPINQRTFEKYGNSKGDNIKDLKRQVAVLNKRIVELQAIINKLNKGN